MMTDHAADTPTPWLKARMSSDAGGCVEMRRNGAVVEVRDSKNPHGPVLRFSGAQFTAWLDGAGNDEFARLTN